MAQNEQTEILRRQISDVKRMAQHFESIRKKVGDLVEKAPRDPIAAQRLLELEQLWNNGLQQKTEQMQQHLQEILRASTQQQLLKRQLKNGVAEVKSPDISTILPAQKARIQKKKVRRFA